MEWWTSLVNGYKTVNDTVVGSMSWVRDNSTPLLTRTLSFGGNTIHQFAEQGLALTSTISSFTADPATQRIGQGMFDIIFYDVLPVVGLNFLNNGVQQYFRAGYESQSYLAPYSLFLTTLTLVDYGVTAYSYRQGVHAVTRTLILDCLGPAAFNANSKPGDSACAENKCTTKRFLSGMVREPLILAASDLLPVLVSPIPYIGSPASQLLRMICIGRYITRLVTPERCERHKDMMSESVLALGISHQVALSLVNATLEASVGLPPFLQQRTIQHMLTLLFVNLAAHMTIPLVKRKKARAATDLLDKYEEATRFVIDVIFAGLLKRIPIDFAPDPETPPLIAIDKLLKNASKLFTGELPLWSYLGPMNGPFQRNRSWLLPSMFNAPLNDVIIKMYWPDVRREAIVIATQIERIKQSTAAQMALSYSPKAVAAILSVGVGIPEKVTKIIIMLTKEEDFWAFVRALKLWFERNDISRQVTLTVNSTISLRGGNLPLPPVDDHSPLIKPNELKSDKPSIDVLSLFATKADSQVTAEQLLPGQPEPVEVSRDNSSSTRHGENPYSVFRRRKQDDSQLSCDDLSRSLNSP
ncbi:MAG: hypothetical protein ACRC0B_07290 [Legionella sp.]